MGRNDSSWMVRLLTKMIHGCKLLATPSGNPTFKRCEQYDHQHQLKAFASKMRAELLKQFRRLVPTQKTAVSRNIPNIGKNNVPDSICGLGDIRNNFQHIPDTE